MMVLEVGGSDPHVPCVTRMAQEAHRRYCLTIPGKYCELYASGAFLCLNLVIPVWHCCSNHMQCSPFSTAEMRSYRVEDVRVRPPNSIVHVRRR